MKPSEPHNVQRGIVAGSDEYRLLDPLRQTSSPDSSKDPWKEGKQHVRRDPSP